MQSIFTSLVYFLCFFAAMAEGLTRQSLNDLAKVYPDTLLHPENGGYYLKDMDGQIVAITADDLCTELDADFARIDANFVDDGSGSEDGGSRSLGDRC
ncbi:unnamed protein product [Penicillium viridicatum]